jgi:hypothetical protein
MAVMPRRACAVNSTYLKPASDDETPDDSGDDVAAAIVAERYRLSLPLARLVCHLAEIGGRL